MFIINYFRLIKEFDREIKDEEGRNPPEVNKQLNDEKQSMVSTLNLSVLEFYTCKVMQYLQCILNFTFKLILFSTSNNFINDMVK